MTGEEAIKAIQESVRLKREKRGDMVITLGQLDAILSEATHPASYIQQAPPQPPQLTVPPEFPKRKIRVDADKRVVEEKLVYNHAEEQLLKKSGESWYTWEG